MNDLDIKALTAEAVKEISGMPLERKGGFLHRYVIKMEATRESISELLINKVWESIIDRLNSLGEASEPLTVERALSILMKKDAIKDKVIFKKDSFRIRMENWKYRAYKHGVTGTVYACPWPEGKKMVINMPGARFAEFLLAFDAAIPEILTQVDGIIEVLKARELEEKKALIERELKEKVLQALVDEYLKPQGLTAKTRFKDGDVVSMEIKQVRQIHLEMPFGDLMNRLCDPDAIMASLETMSN